MRQNDMANAHTNGITSNNRKKNTATKSNVLPVASCGDRPRKTSISLGYWSGVEWLLNTYLGASMQSGKLNRVGE